PPTVGNRPVPNLGIPSGGVLVMTVLKPRNASTDWAGSAAVSSSVAKASSDQRADFRNLDVMRFSFRTRYLDGKLPRFSCPRGCTQLTLQNVPNWRSEIRSCGE